MRRLLLSFLAPLLPASFTRVEPASPMLPSRLKQPLLAKHRDSNVPLAAPTQRRWSASYTRPSRFNPSLVLGFLSLLISLLALLITWKPDLLHSILSSTHPHSHASAASTSRAEAARLHLSPIVVGPRRFEPQYHGRGCNSTGMLEALRRTRIREDGASRRVNTTLPRDRLDIADGSFDFSYDLEGCPAPHLYNAEEACDLLQSLGGVILRGDSFVRHVVNALFMLLQERTDGAVEREGERCRGNAMFDDRAAHCRENSLVSTQTTAQPICNGEAHLFFDLQAWGSQPAHLSLDTYNTWLATRPPHKRMLSPVFMAGFGLHNRLDSGTAVLGFIRPFLALASQAFPRPLGLWLATHAPAPGKPAAWAEAQDAAHVLAYNEVVAGALEALAGGEVEGLVGERGMTEVSWYCATDGAESYDGSHYSEQVNLEKALIILNLLDVAWGEARDAGGLLMTY